LCGARNGWFLILGELGWWIVPNVFAANGVTLRMQHYSRDEDWLPFMLAVVMIIGAPLLTLKGERPCLASPANGPRRRRLKPFFHNNRVDALVEDHVAVVGSLQDFAMKVSGKSIAADFSNK
jgi:hypothetical protein